MPDIEQLGIKITSEVKSDSAKIDNLANSLNKLQSILDKGFGQLDISVQKLNSINVGANFATSGKAINSFTNSLKKLSSLGTLDIASLEFKIDGIAKSLQSFSSVSVGANVSETGKAINSFTNSLKKLSSLGTLDIASLEFKIDGIAKSLQSFSSVSVGANVSETGKAINSLANGLNKIVALDIDKIAPSIAKIATALKPLTDEMLRGGNAATAYAQVLSSLSKTANIVGKTATTTTPKMNNFSKSLIKVGSLTYLLRRAITFSSQMLKATAAWTENLNLFAVTFGKGQYEPVLQWVKDISTQFGFATNQLLKFTGLFKQLSTSLGITESVGTELSKTLTNLSLDFASFFNIDLERTFATFQSAIFGGQTKGSRLLFGVETAYQSLDQTLKNLSGTYTALGGVSARMLAQSDKALLRSIEFLNKGKNAWGDMYKTSHQMANQMRIFTGSVENLKLAFGDLLFAEPFKNILMHINGVIIGITSIIRAFVPFRNDVAILDDMATGFSGVEDEIDGVNKSLGLLSFDKFEVLGESGGTSANTERTLALQAELDRLTKEYNDKLAQSEQYFYSIGKSATSIAESIKNWFIVTDKNGGFLEWTNQASELADTLKLAGSAVIGLKAGLLTGSPVIGLIVGLLSFAFASSEDFRKSIIHLSKSILKLLPPIMGIITSIANIISPIINMLVPFLDILIKGITWVLDLLSPILEWFSKSEIAINILAVAITGVFGLAAIVIKYWQPISEFFSNMWKNIANGFAAAINWIANGFISFVNFFINIINGMLIPISKLSKFFGGSEIKIPNWEATVNWQPYPNYKANGGVIDTRGGDTLAVINEHGANELVYSNNSKQVEVSNQQSLKVSFKEALNETMPYLVNEVIQEIRKQGKQIINIDGKQVGETSSVANGVMNRLKVEGKI